ncbi:MULTISPECIES: tRNA lysidine(34) synthetase TilS [Pseudoxanthomonas]|uniref:tRNA(Ile)-lysidine synthase n=1 Tax=Pseudoxanthomonas winnipegensis TaxID=2480810 RepID=A0AAW8G9N4_9GAMM|nr:MULTISPECIES: tRNA lysidine(34) synthetase TilS [Pseudoxanthomonas]MDQ1118612.1 tRNA(Ile)-lysidine synthase [Pseudoxanthomonas winnipegensis]MDQ1131796.1 tRNA(Ile)-lysidine synthase [Pseudoxanthomonas winnipegensis]MDR6138184.1 tRNA(Ile)-lysidine synthase [Pseudoxanthomonas sp. SORGH_AS_0997]
MAPPTDLLAALPATTPEAALWVALSGGLDSTALLHALAATWPGRVRAVHVHHGLHADADAWEAHCVALCARLQVPLRVERVVVERAGEGLEAAARRARHAAFARVLRPGDLLVAAHHRDDQAETFLLRALRASGPEGLAAMRPLRPFAQGQLWRPWLDLPRSAILAYAQAHDLRWVEDPSNADAALDRNFLRHHVLPLLRQRWPHADAALARSAALSAQADALLQQLDQDALDRARADDAQLLSVPALQALSPELRARVVRRWIATLGLPSLPAQGIVQLESSLLDAGHDAQARFDWGEARLQRWRDLLHAGRATPPLPRAWRTHWRGDAPLALPGGGELRLQGAAFEAPVQVGARQGGERIQLPGRTHSHALKHALQAAGIPPWQRAQLPLLRDAEGRVLAMGDRLLSGPFQAWLEAQNARLHWTPPGRV